MNATLQVVLVAALVLAAVTFSVWKLMPARWRLRVLLAMDSRAANQPRLARWRERVLRPRIARAAGSGCDGCAAQDLRAPRPPR